jgi:hypothetical protein
MNQAWRLGLVLIALLSTAACGDDDASGEDVAGDTGARDDAGGDVAADARDDGGTEADGTLPPAGRVIDHACTDPSLIPAAAMANARDTLHVVYQHTSHGSQLITGMNALESFPAFADGRFAWDDSGAAAGALDLDDNGIPADAPDLSQGDWVNDDGDTPWVVGTRALLDNPANAHVNVVMWSWCSIDGHDATRYVENMEKLVAEYPDVTFVFMTGHAQGQGETLEENNVHYNNELIRRHCRENGRWLFDFADVESYDPSGTYFWDRDMQDNLDYDGEN